MEVEQVDSVETVAPVVESPKTKKPFKSGFVVGILLFLIVCLLGGLTYYVLKDSGTDLLSGIVKDDTTENSETDNNGCETNPIAKACELVLDNSGWGLFSMPEYKFSVEVPSYTMTQKLMDEDIISIWKLEHSTTSTDTSLLENYLHTVTMGFNPMRIPDGLGCGQGCVNEHYFVVNIFENKGSKDIAVIKDIYKANWTTEYLAEDPEMGSLTGEIANKWGMSVWEFSAQFIAGGNDGYLIATDNFIYEVVYFKSDSPVASEQIAQKVLDSMKFEE